MSSFELSDALEGSPEFPAYNDKVFDMTGVQEQIFRLDEGQEMVVSVYPHSMQNVATLILAVNRVKSCLSRHVRERNNRELCSALISSLVEETVEETKINFCSENPKKLFRRLSSTEQANLCGLSQKNVVLRPGTFELEAIILKAGELRYKVNFLLQKYCLSPCGGQPCQPILLSIPDRSKYISCSKKSGKAVLQLEDKLELETIDGDTEESRFLFYRRTTGSSMNTFESVSCPGWFISVQEEGEEMKMRQESNEYTSFKVNEIQS